MSTHNSYRKTLICKYLERSFSDPTTSYQQSSSLHEGENANATPKTYAVMPAQKFALYGEMQYNANGFWKEDS
jgi:hypothetical protein